MMTITVDPTITPGGLYHVVIRLYSGLICSRYHTEFDSGRQDQAIRRACRASKMRYEQLDRVEISSTAYIGKITHNPKPQHP